MLGIENQLVGIIFMFLIINYIIILDMELIGCLSSFQLNIISND